MTDPCIEWNGYRDRDGYGQRGRNIKVHREVWETANGPIPKGACVLHSCDNPACYQLSHLRLGTNADNTADMMRRDRCRIWTRKLSYSQVQSIRQRVAAGEVQRAIAREMGLHPTTVNNVVRGRTWKEVPYV